VECTVALYSTNDLQNWLKQQNENEQKLKRKDRHEQQNSNLDIPSTSSLEHLLQNVHSKLRQIVREKQIESNPLRPEPPGQSSTSHQTQKTHYSAQSPSPFNQTSQLQSENPEVQEPTLGFDLTTLTSNAATELIQKKKQKELEVSSQKESKKKSLVNVEFIPKTIVPHAVRQKLCDRILEVLTEYNLSQTEMHDRARHGELEILNKSKTRDDYRSQSASWFRNLRKELKGSKK